MLWRGRSKPKTKRELAIIGEEHAARYLTSRGYRVLERNYRTSRGEVDIIAEHGDTLVFVEVKARSSDEFGEPREAVTTWKQRRIARAAAAYLSAKERRERATRFDVVEVSITPQGRVEKIDVIEGAFGAEG
jgi:putative endonuclease